MILLDFSNIIVGSIMVAHRIPNEERTMFDLRINDDSKDYAQGSWINITPFLFTAFFSDGTEIEVQVNDEFENNIEAESVALSYLKVIGKLPKLFRKEVETIWIHKGNEDFGGGNNNLLIHHDRGLEYLRDGFLEEVFQPFFFQFETHLVIPSLTIISVIFVTH